MLSGNMLNNIFNISKKEDIDFECDIYKLYSQTSYEKTIELLNNHLHDFYTEISYIRIDDSKCQIDLQNKNEKLKLIFQVNRIDSSGRLLYQFSYKKVRIN
jgi:hypothetical protein